MTPEYYMHKDFEDGRHACVVPLTFERARIVISEDDGHYFVSDSW